MFFLSWLLSQIRFADERIYPSYRVKQIDDGTRPRSSQAYYLIRHERLIRETDILSVEVSLEG